MLYVESSALLKRYVIEPDTELALRIMDAESTLVTSRLAEVEVRRNLVRLLTGSQLTDKRREFHADLAAFELVVIDETVFEDAAHIAEETLCRSLDALHIAAARRVSPAATMLTFDQRQAHAASTVGLNVVGA